jgi:hypothetical protein
MVTEREKRESARDKGDGERRKIKRKKEEYKEIKRQ